jgi:hypothetical protein
MYSGLRARPAPRVHRGISFPAGELVELIQVDVTEDGRCDAALRASAERAVVFPVLQVPGFEHVADQPEKPLIVDVLRQDRGHYLVVQRSEAVGDVTLDKPRGPFPEVADFPQRGVASAAFAEPVGLARELRFVIRLQEQAHYLADQLI